MIKYERHHRFDIYLAERPTIRYGVFNQFMFCKHKIFHPLFQCTEKYTKIIDLASDYLSAIDKQTTYEHRRAIRDGYHSAEVSDMKVYADFFRQWSLEKGRGDNNRNKDFEKNKSLLCITAAVDAQGEIQVMHGYLYDPQESRVILQTSSSRIYSTKNDASKRAEIGRANRMLHIEDMHLFRGKGIRTYDLGGYAYGTSNHQLKGINRFKDSFGGELVKLYTYNSRLRVLIKKLLNIKSTITRLKLQKCWSVRIFTDKDQGEIIPITQWEKKYDFTWKAFDFRRNAIKTYADPFLFSHDNTAYLFMERVVRNGHGTIVFSRSNDLIHWSNPEEILQEPFHLSFPFIFQYQDSFFMLPEAGASGELRLYKFTDFPRKPVLEQVLLSGKRLVDSSLIEYQNRWYLFTTESEQKNGKQSYVLCLYHADSPFGPFVQHPSSPLTQDMKCARNGGAVQKIGNRLIRPAQDCSKSYGGNLTLFEIKELSEEKYQEEVLISDLYPTGTGFFTLGGHHLNISIFNDENVYLADGLRARGKIDSLWQMVLTKIYRKY